MAKTCYSKKLTLRYLKYIMIMLKPHRRNFSHKKIWKCRTSWPKLCLSTNLTIGVGVSQLVCVYIAIYRPRIISTHSANQDKSQNQFSLITVAYEAKHTYDVRRFIIVGFSTCFSCTQSIHCKITNI
jgi:hypothetical protein